MYCPQCRMEYREGFTECTDCKTTLLAGSPPPQRPSEFDPSMDTVELMTACDSVQLAMARGLLENAGIPFLLLGRIATLVNDVDPFVQKRVRIQVPRDREAEAREVMDLILNPDPSLGEAADAEEAAGEAAEKA